MLLEKELAYSTKKEGPPKKNRKRKGEKGNGASGKRLERRGLLPMQKEFSGMFSDSIEPVSRENSQERKRGAISQKN